MYKGINNWILKVIYFKGIDLELKGINENDSIKEM